MEFLNLLVQSKKVARLKPRAAESSVPLGQRPLGWQPFDFQQARAAVRLLLSPTNGFARLFRERFSNTTTDSPTAINCSTTTLPMYPAPPVTRIFIPFFFIENVSGGRRSLGVVLNDARFVDHGHINALAREIFELTARLVKLL